MRPVSSYCLIRSCLAGPLLLPMPALMFAPCPNDARGNLFLSTTFVGLPLHTDPRYDQTSGNMLATCGNDSLVKVWDVATGDQQSVLRGSPGHVITSCDIGDSLVIGAGTDKTCRVWNLRTERMVHQLVGHASKITCARLFGGQKAVVTGSADRSLKIWDVDRKTYRQTTTLRHGSTAYSVDAGLDSFTIVSGHMDGGVRFWDARTGDRTADIAELHTDSVTSVQFNPRDQRVVVTNGKDSCLKLVDLRTGVPIHTLRHADFTTRCNWSAAAFSPDGTHPFVSKNNLFIG